MESGISTAVHKVILVAGGTGGVGKQIINQLLQEKSVQVRALVRNKERAAGLFPKDKGDVEFVVGDVSNKSSLADAMKHVDGIICTIGAKGSWFGESTPYHIDYLGVVNLVDAAKAGGVKDFVLVSSSSVTKTVSFLNLLGKMGTWKLRGENHLRQSGLNYVIVRPVGLKDEAPSGKPLKFGQGDNLGFGWIGRSTVATACIKAMKTLWTNESSDKGLKNFTFEMMEPKSGGVPMKTDDDWIQQCAKFKKDSPSK